MATRSNDCEAFQDQMAENLPCSVRGDAVSSRTMKLRETIHDSESQRLAQRVATLEETLFGVMECNAQLKEENARLREDNARLQQQLAAARRTPRLPPNRRRAIWSNRPSRRVRAKRSGNAAGSRDMSSICGPPFHTAAVKAHLAHQPVPSLLSGGGKKPGVLAGLHRRER